jgi:hypothetical protein
MTPATGETRTYTNHNGARAYVVLGTDTVFSRRRGCRVDLIVWEGTCRECGMKFRTATGTSRRTIERGPEIVHCPTHRTRCANGRF